MPPKKTRKTRLGHQPFAEKVENWDKLAANLGAYKRSHVYRVGLGDVAPSDELREDLVRHFGRPLKELLTPEAIAAKYHRRRMKDLDPRVKKPGGFRGSGPGPGTVRSQ